MLDAWGLDVWQGDGDFFDVEDTESADINPSGSDDGYSTFEMIMIHDNKIKLLETINHIKNKYNFEKQEDALMELVINYKK